MAPSRSSRHQDHSTQPTQCRSPHNQQTVDVGASLLTPIMDSRTNAELNLSVLRRHNPSIVHVLSIAPYAVIYIFSTDFQTWEKTGIEGTLFVCQLDSDEAPAENDDDFQPEERYQVVVLNRRGLDNFELDLCKAEDVEITEEYVILQGIDTRALETSDGERGDSSAIYGLWIFAEPVPSSTADMRAINAKVIQDCAWRAEASRNSSREKSTIRVQKGRSSGFGTPITQHPLARDIFGRDAGNVAYSTENSREFNGSTENYAGPRSGDELEGLLRKMRQEHSSNG